MFDGECEGTCFFWSMNWCISWLINLRGQCPKLCDFPILKTWYGCQTLKPCDFTVKSPGRPTKIKTTKGIGCNYGGDKSARWFLSQQASFQNWSYQKQKAGPSPLKKGMDKWVSIIDLSVSSTCLPNITLYSHCNAQPRKELMATAAGATSSKVLGGLDFLDAASYAKSLIFLTWHGATPFLWATCYEHTLKHATTRQPPGILFGRMHTWRTSVIPIRWLLPPLLQNWPHTTTTLQNTVYRRIACKSWTPKWPVKTLWNSHTSQPKAINKPR